MSSVRSVSSVGPYSSEELIMTSGRAVNCLVESRDDSQHCVVRNNTHIVVTTTTEKRVAEHEQQSDYPQENGEQSSGPSSPDNETDPAVSQMMNGQEQQSGFQQADGGQVNGLSYSVQETGEHQAQRANGQPYAEAGCVQACGCSYPVQETGHIPFAGRRPGEHENLPPCYQQHNGDHINAASSVSQRKKLWSITVVAGSYNYGIGN
ncbi:hypothetical protein OS493_028166 [Desmophyllum pertusum]|uniref:Uncharacterized protein n=1 Tax=Desmophyllum pertusum TaxID=174260 RepID=A0A9X0CVZ8_9CNID|nr:hypothetical protein OS493_028166 [Desmophyllum pertusum]